MGVDDMGVYGCFDGCVQMGVYGLFNGCVIFFQDGCVVAKKTSAGCVQAFDGGGYTPI